MDAQELNDFENKIIEHWKNLNLRSIDDPIDLLDATTDFLQKHEKVDPESLKFSDAFVSRIRIDAERRKLLEKSKKSLEEEKMKKETFELDL